MRERKSLRLKHITFNNFAKIVSELSAEHGDKRLKTIGSNNHGEYIFYLDDGTEDGIAFKVPMYERSEA